MTEPNRTMGMNPSERILVDLTEDERQVLCRGLNEWGGPALCTKEMAVAMGFADIDDIAAQKGALIGSILLAEPLTRLDWLRVLLATEIVFASDVVGSGVDWPTTTGYGDLDTLQILRRIQRKLTGSVRGLIGRGHGTRTNTPDERAADVALLTEMAKSSYGPGANAHVVSVAIVGDRAEVVIDTVGPHYPYFMYFVRHSGEWQEGPSGNAETYRWFDPEEYDW